MAPSNLVLITGSTGHVGLPVLLKTLQAGYPVRASVRSDSKAQTILNNKVFKAAKIPAGLLTFVTVPDITVPGAFNEAIKDVEYIIHVASPIPGTASTPEEYEKLVITPAVKGTVGILDSALKSNKIKRVVITSSAVAVIPIANLMGFAPYDKILTAENRIAFDEGPYGSEAQAYCASKAAALNKTDEWVATNKPTFDLVHIHPSYVLGPNDFVTDRKDAHSGSNATLLTVATGKGQIPPGIPGSTVAVDDVARLHVDSLNSKIPPGSYLASWVDEKTGEGAVWNDAHAIIDKYFPEAVKSGIVPNNTEVPAVPQRLDVSNTEKTFGFKLKNFEEQVKDLIGWYVDLAGSKL
jgi:nucleoside-diphosphate-sugar epimerase